MDYSKFSKLKICTLFVAMVAVTACSSSQVEEGQDAPPPETVSDVQNPSPDAAAATTDPVPAAAPDANAVASAGQPPAGGTDPALDAAALNAPQDAPAPGAMDSSPIADAPNAAAAASDPMATDPTAAGTAPASEVAQAPMTDAANVDPLATAPASVDPAPVDVAAVTPSSDMGGADAKPKKGKKGKKHSKGAAHVAKHSKSGHSTVAAGGTGMAGDGVHYSVKGGDTLMKIAFENYGDLYRWKEIYEANRDKIQDPNHVPPGTQLTLNGAGMVQIERNGDRYLIKHGDTLGTISKSVYGTNQKWKKLWENNRQLIKDPNKIYAGFYLYYQPEGRMANSEPVTQPSAANTTAQGVSPGVQAAMKSAPATIGNVAQNTATAPQVPANAAPANTGARAPASVK